MGKEAVSGQQSAVSDQEEGGGIFEVGVGLASRIGTLAGGAQPALLGLEKRRRY